MGLVLAASACASNDPATPAPSASGPSQNPVPPAEPDPAVTESVERRAPAPVVARPRTIPTPTTPTPKDTPTTPSTTQEAPAGNAKAAQRVGSQLVTTYAFLDHLASARVEGPHLPSSRPLFDKVDKDQRRGVTVQNPWGGDGDNGAMHVRVRKTRTDRVMVDLRDCLVVPLVGAASFEVDVLPHSTLAFSIEFVGMGRGRGTLRVTATADGKETELFKEDRRQKGLFKNQWDEHRIALDAFAGKKVTFRFEVDDPRMGDKRWSARGKHKGVGLFALPRILTRLRTEDTALRKQVKQLIGDEMNDNVVMIVFDSMRADLIPPVRDQRKRIPPMTPNLDAFTKKSVGFTQAFSVGNQTRVGSYSFYTAVPPSAGGYWQTNWKFSDKTRKEFYDQQLHSLPRELHKAGYLTGHLGFNGFLIGHLYLALDMGFDFVGEFNGVPENTVRMTDGIIEWLKEHKDQKFFLLIWYDPPHFPYVPPKGYKERVYEAGVEKDFRYFAHGYLGKLIYGDDHFGRLMRSFEELGLTDKTMFVLTGDHGEAMDPRHDGYSKNVNTRVARHHGKSFFDEEIHVPLSFRWDGVLKPGQRDEQVSLLSLGPTILGLLGLPTDFPKQLGRSFEALVRGEKESSTRTAYFEGRWSYGIRKDGYKYIYHDPRERLDLTKKSLWQRSRDGVHELYDIRKDPDEQQNLASEHPELRDKLYQEYLAYRAKLRKFRKEVLKQDDVPRPMKDLD